MRKLDTDVIQTVCGSIEDIHDLLSLSLTSSVVWHIAIRQVLRTHTIHLGSRKAIRSFRGFIINRNSTCAHHLRSLVIPDTAWTTHEAAHPDGDVRQVMDILDCAVNLDTLDLSLDPSYGVTPRVSSTFATIEALRNLSLTEPLRPWDTCWVHHALRALRSPLVTLCIRSKPEYLSDSSPSTLASQFGQSLSHFSTSSMLISLHLGRIPMYDDSFLGLPQFPSVRSLTIAEPLLREPRLNALLHLFPSLDGTLRLRMEFWNTLDISSSPEKLAGIQEQNRRAQGASRWARLDRLDCESTTAQMLALRCPVRHLTINSFDISAVASIHPQHLVIDSIRLPFCEDISQYHTDAPASIHASSTTHVVLIVSCEAKEYEDANSNSETETDDIRWKTVLKHTVCALSAFPHVTHARLVFHCYKDSPCGEEMDDLVRDMHDASVSGSGSPPPRGLAECPALRCFVMTIAGRDETKSDPAFQRWVRTRAWRVVDDAGEGQGRPRKGGKGKGDREGAPRTFEELSDYEAGRIIEDEDMGLPDEWERRLEACRA